jgi:hypothetical protein
VGVHEVSWEGSGTEPTGEYTLFYGMENGNHELGICHLHIRESYMQLRGFSLLMIGFHICIILRGHWCHIIVLNVHAPTEDKTDDVKDNIYEELEPHEYSVRKSQCQSRQGRHFNPTTGSESLHEMSNDNGVRLVNFATSKILRVKSTMFPHCNIHKYIWKSQSD